MKKLNSLLLVTATLAGTLPVIVLSSCNKKKEEVAKMEIDASEAYMEVFGQYTNEYATSGTAYIMGFKFKNCDISNIEASVEGLTGITATTTCEIVPNEVDPSYLNVYITFESEEIIYAKTATFSLVFTNKLDKENKVKIDGCSVTFKNKMINVIISGTYFDFKFLNKPNEIDANCRIDVTDAIGLPITDISDFIFEITPLGGTPMKVTATPDSTHDSKGYYHLNFKLTDVEFGSNSYILTIKHKQLPNWFEYFGIIFKIEQTDTPFKYDLVDNKELKVTKLLVNDAEITIPDTAKFNDKDYPVTIIDREVFPYQDNLKKVNIGNNIPSIPAGAFRGCYNLVEVNIPKNVKQIYSDAFLNCKKLERLNVADDNPIFSNKTVKGGSEYAGCIWATNSNTLVISSINPIIPNEVTKIDNNGFVNSQLEEIVLPERITDIGEGSFANSSKLKRVKLPSKIKNISGGAFKNCQQLETVTISEGTQTIEANAFYECSSLTDITLPSTLTSINDRNVFARCYSLEHITLPTNLKKIGQDTFTYCTSLKELNIPKDVTSITDSITIGCTSLNKLTVDPENTVFTSNYGNTEVNCIIRKADDKVISGSNNSIVPEGIKFIGNFAFSGLSIDNMVCPSSLNEIGIGAFMGSTIKTVDLSACASLTILSRAFQNAYLLTSVKMPAALSRIDQYAFANCVSLKELDLSGQTFTHLPQNLCEGCTGLETVKLPSTVTKIDDQAFNDCSSLKQINLPEGLTEIHMQAFSRCSTLQNITLPTTLTRIDVDAFIGSGLKSITIPASVTNLEVAFKKCNDLESIIVADDNTIYSSKDSDGKQCNCIYTIATKELNIGCKSTTIPKDILTIGQNAFFCIDTLTKITIPSSVTCIEKYAIAGCEGLEQVVFENPNNWYMDSKQVEVDLSDPEIAAWFIYLNPGAKLTRQN